MPELFPYLVSVTENFSEKQYFFNIMGFLSLIKEKY